MDDLKAPQIRRDFPPDEPRTPAQGLSETEAEARMQAGQGNICQADAGKSFGQILAGNLLTWFNLLNVLLGICLVLVGSYRNMLFLLVAVINAVIGTVQEIRAHRTIAKLQLMNMPTVTVIRDGKEKTLSSDALVKGDLAVLHGGDQVPADAVVVDGAGSADESLLTGESDAVKKTAGEWLMSGSYVTEGRLTAQLVYVGEESYAARLTHSAKQIKRPKSQLMTELDKLIRRVSIVLLPLGALLFCKQVFLLHDPLTAAVPSSVAAMIGMIPEGLVLLTSVAMALGVIRLGQKQALVQELSGIETLARADVLCLDKTGTLTSGSMKLEKLLPIDADEAEMKAALSRFLCAFDEHSGTLDALRGGIDQEEGGKKLLRGTVPFSGRRKLSAASYEGYGTLILGAPGFVPVQGDGQKWRKAAEENAALGLRVLVLAYTKEMITGEEPPAASRILGLCCLSDELRPHVEETMAYFTRQGVSLKVISGDDPRTVSQIARRAGLPNWEKWADASTLDSDEKLEAAIQEKAVFGRVTPAQKQKFVEALKKAGHSVAMTGDGVNDIPALKTADCSIAMAGGSDAAKHAAQITLLNADFSVMPEIVAQGRRVIANITRSATLFLTKTLYSMLLTVLLLILPGSYPFQPIQLTLISSLFIGAPSFVLALEPNEDRMKGQFLRQVLRRALPGAVAVAACSVASMLLENHFGCTATICSTLATLSTGFVSLLTLLRVAWPLNKLRLALVVVMSLAFVLAVVVLGQPIFLLVPLEGVQLLILAALCAAGTVIFLLMTLIMNKIVKKESLS